MKFDLLQMNLVCKTTFRDSAMRRNPSKEQWDALTKHHWVHRWKLEGRCRQCSKSFQQKMFRDKVRFFRGEGWSHCMKFPSQEVIAITCSWCKQSYHNKRSCFSLDRFEEKCDRGVLRDMVLPPSWLLRLSNTRKRHGKSANSSGHGNKKAAKRKVSNRNRTILTVLVFKNEVLVPPIHREADGPFDPRSYPATARVRQSKVGRQQRLEGTAHSLLVAQSSPGVRHHRAKGSKIRVSEASIREPLLSTQRDRFPS